MPKRFDVAIIGGGIMGASAAHYLAKAGRSAALIERGEIGRDQSSRNWGFVRQQGRHPVELPLMVESNRIWQGLRDELEADVGWVQGGNLALAPDAEKMGEFEEWRDLASQHGLDTRLLSRNGLEEEFPMLHGEFAGAMFTRSDGHADPQRVAAAFAASAKRLGASVITSNPVESISTSGGAVTGVVTARGEIAADRVVVTAGAHSSRLLRSLGVSLPQRVVRATVASTPPMPPTIRAGVWAEEVSFCQRADGRIVFAAGASADYDLRIDMMRHLPLFLPNYWKNKAIFRFHVGKPLLAEIAGLVPGTHRHNHPFAVSSSVEPKPNQRRVKKGRNELSTMLDAPGITVERAWAGDVDATPDAIPVIDAVSSWDGLVVATGFSGHGFALGPVTGKIIEELINQGRSSFDLHPMRLARFAERDLAPPRSVL